ncbi:RcnB family protein [Paracoccus marinaquae]|uniref:RcnB family protein n=1 Tax=Paracoccus marinaquae TaxID=2841926 RepID=A0ABS6AIN1_9RHOB|nr:RcnB family protein [Paracoccus marinaquae]MBU3030452.1 RcnB family protein [Paracoccus marinaquae]
MVASRLFRSAATGLAIALAAGPVLHLLPGASIPAALADDSKPQVGDLLPEGSFHPISNPGLYGLGPEPRGSRYAVASGLLVRIDVETGKILSILRQQDEILD